MELAITIACIVVLVIIISIRNYNNNKKEIISELNYAYGKPDVHALDDEHLKELKKIVENDNSTISNECFDDLNMDRIFGYLDQSVSAVGEEYFYMTLHSPISDTEMLKKRNELAEDLKEDNLDIRINLQQIHKQKRNTIYRCINTLLDAPILPVVFHVICFLLFVGSIALSIVKPNPGVFVLIAVICFNTVMYFIAKSTIASYFDIIHSIVNWIFVINKLEVSKEKKQAYYHLEEMKHSAKTFNSLKRYSWLFAPQSVIGSLVDMVLDYIKFITHIDLIMYCVIIKKLRANKNEMLKLYYLTGEFELGIIINGIRAMDKTTCVPVITTNGELSIEAQEMVHPLLKNPVANDVYIKKNMLITGSNASGKSTFLKMVAVNCLLSETIVTAFAKDYKASYFDIMSSLNIHDDIDKGDSFYIAEIKRIKSIIDNTSNNDNTLVLIDEILKGTNTSERIAASTEILRYIANSKSITLAATHDVELTNLLNKEYDNYYFTENPNDPENIFDYKIHRGNNYTGNAIRLLEIYGYPDEIIKASRKHLSAK